MKAVDMWAIGFSILIAIVFLNFIMKHKKYYLRLEDEETKKMVKAGFLLYSFLLFSQITVETLAFFGYTIYFYTDGDFGIFVIINSAICLYFSIRFYMNKMVLSTSETITESFLEKYLITPREKEVIEKLIIGLSNKEIGESMDITEGTVKVFVYNIYQKVGVKNRMSLARIAKSEIN
jgi:DNA-binding CsgD family transcriptional regulator